jgi:hypothetical protein
MQSPQIIEILAEAIMVGGQSSLTAFNLSHFSMGSNKLCAQPGVGFLKLRKVQTLLNLRRLRIHSSLCQLYRLREKDTS